MDLLMSNGNAPVSDFYVALGTKLRRIRNARRLSLDAVEADSDGRFSAPALGGYERGTRRIGLDVLYALLEYYRVPVETVLPDVGERDAVMVRLDDVMAMVESLRGVEA